MSGELRRALSEPGYDPVVDSEDGFAEQALRLIAQKGYENGGEQ